MAATSIWIKLRDFGICKRLTETTKPRALLGTIRYFAPDVTRDIFANMGSGGHASTPYTTAVDICSVGIMTHELLTKFHPFTNNLEVVKYAEGRIQFPKHSLEKRWVSVEAILFISCCLRA